MSVTDPYFSRSRGGLYVSIKTPQVVKPGELEFLKIVTVDSFSGVAQVDKRGDAHQAKLMFTGFLLRSRGPRLAACPKAFGGQQSVRRIADGVLYKSA